MPFDCAGNIFILQAFVIPISLTYVVSCQNSLSICFTPREVKNLWLEIVLVGLMNELVVLAEPPELYIDIDQLLEAKKERKKDYVSEMLN